MRGLANRLALTCGALSAKSYVQDGLIAMWDGIENAGWGTHDANATTWVDLIGGVGNMTRYGNLVTFSNYSAIWGENAGLSQNYFSTNKYTSITNIQTVESCFYLPNKYGSIFAFAGSGIQLEFSNDRYASTGYLSDAHSGSFDIPVNVKETVSLTTENTVSCFLNGVQLTRKGTGKYNGAYRNSIGAAGWLNTEAHRIAEGGMIFNVRAYDRILTAAEIAANYDVDKVRFGLT